jgi:uncharacterized protein with ParB-like and HNH nuclease domain
MNSEIKLETKLVGDITGNFFVPSYQRGYRWGKEEVTRLLEDIYSNGSKTYCLQPVVVRKDSDRFELIDGQQRLTTLFILLQYIKREYKPRISLKYELSYETRSNSADYLNNIDERLADSNIDFYHIFHAYKAIDDWFSNQSDSVVAADDIYGYLVKYVKIIWYEVGESEDAISLFTRLNIGKIPLTNAELVKAVFLSKDTGNRIDKEKQEEISLQWDNMEKELHNNSLWCFLTNKSNEDYQTRIDLVLDLISNKPADSKEIYYTFFEFDKMRQSESLEDIWRRIQKTFLVLKDWHENHELYHKIGYLIASETLTLQKIFDLSKGKTKDAFRDLLDEFIRNSIKIEGNYSDLSYEKPSDQKKITTLLLLFNVESVRKNGAHSQWFPFDKYKYGKGGKVTWSLEHIHAQHSEGLRTQEMWKEWLTLHIPSVKSVRDHSDELIGLMNDAIAKDKLERQEFDAIQQKVVDLLSVKGNTEYLHSIANMALLSTGDNAALNNSTFDVKRNEIIKMDKAGQYIPFCTRMVFLKYYTTSTDNQLHFWGHADRVAYVDAINTVLANYLEEPIVLEKEDE